MNTFIQVVPQQSAQTSTPSISISKQAYSSTKEEFEKYRQNLLANPGQTLYDYCKRNGLSYNRLRAYASYKHINIRNLRVDSVSGNNSRNLEHGLLPHVVVKISNASFDISEISIEQLMALMERFASHV